jgi:hypothetical protein
MTAKSACKIVACAVEIAATAGNLVAYAMLFVTFTSYDIIPAVIVALSMLSAIVSYVFELAELLKMDFDIAVGTTVRMSRCNVIQLAFIWTTVGLQFASIILLNVDVTASSFGLPMLAWSMNTINSFLFGLSILFRCAVFAGRTVPTVSAVVAVNVIVIDPAAASYERLADP